jgi:hypothetical protein
MGRASCHRSIIRPSNTSPIQESSKASGKFEIYRVRFESCRVRAQAPPEFKRQLHKRINGQVRWAISSSTMSTRASTDPSCASPQGNKGSLWRRRRARAFNLELCRCAGGDLNGHNFRSRRLSNSDAPGAQGWLPLTSECYRVCNVRVKIC